MQKPPGFCIFFLASQRLVNFNYSEMGTFANCPFFPKRLIINKSRLPGSQRKKPCRPDYYGIWEDNMTGMIFFGGLVIGFLIGWIGLAFLTMSSLSNRDQELVDEDSHNLL